MYNREREVESVTVKITGPTKYLNKISDLLIKNFLLISKSELLQNDRGQPGHHQFIILYGGEPEE
jgi:hypothetical protein